MEINKLGFVFELNNDNFTAKIIRSLSVRGDVIIPSMISYNSNVYTITSIEKYSFKGQKNIKSIIFSSGSGVLVIKKKAFFRSSVIHISLPPSIGKLEDGWCHSTPKLVSISISPQNKRFLFYDNKFLIGKSNQNSEKFDILLFARRDIQQEILPPFIKKITKYSFCDCKTIKTIQFPENSEIQTIQKSSFFNSSIEKVHIPSSMKEIEEGWCKKAKKLKQISISPNNKNFLFYENSLLFGKTDQNSDIFDIILFACNDIKDTTIPDYIKIIGSHSFDERKSLKSLNFSPNSHLKCIGKKSFINTSIQSIEIPSCVEYIENSAFFQCKKLIEVIFPADSQLHSIGESAFDSTAIENLLIPSNITEIKSKAFHRCTHLKKVQFEKNSKLQKIGDEAFLLNAIHEICFPSSLIEIGEQSFAFNYDLVLIQFPPDSKLKIIKKGAFMKTAVLNIEFPSTIKEIGKKAFYECFQLQSVRFDFDSEIETFESEMFFETKIHSLSIPSNVKEIKEDWCIGISELNNISLSPNNTHFKYIDNKFLFGKSDEKSNIFDTLIYANHDIKDAIIPSFTKYIGPYSFSSFSNLKSVTFENESQLVSIGRNAFTSSSLEYIFIPSSTSRIDQSAFDYCYNLEKIENFENLKIRSIERNTFAFTKLDSISIPSTVEELKDGWCGGIYFSHIFVSPNNKRFSIIDGMLVGKTNEDSDIFDNIYYCCNREIKQVEIFSYVKKIKSEAFFQCKQLRSVTYQKDSNLTAIEEFAFDGTIISSILIPSSVEKIGKYSFSDCCKLKSVKFDDNSKLLSIEQAAFQNILIETIEIPKSLKRVGTIAFENCRNLLSMEFLGDEISFDENWIVNTSLRVISFPNARKVNNIINCINAFKNDISIFVPVGSEIY